MKKCTKLKRGVKATLIICLIVAVLISWAATYGAIHLTRYSQGVNPTEEQVAASSKYEHVVIFGVDGAGGYFSNAEAAPNFSNIYARGSVSYTAYSQMPTTSAYNWASMFTGVRYQTHKITNEVAETTRFSSDEYPTFFKAYADQNPDAEMLSVVNWSPINYGCIEEGIPGMTKINAGEYAEEGSTGAEVDDKVCEIILDYLETSTPDILYMQFDSVDGAGHDGGYGCEAFKEAITHIDSLIGKIYNKYIENDVGEDTLFITISDHGHGVLFPGHGKNFATQRYITFAVAGGHGDIIYGTPGHEVSQDVASVVAYAMGFSQPAGWESRVPYGMFKNLPNEHQTFWDLIAR